MNRPANLVALGLRVLSGGGAGVAVGAPGAICSSKVHGAALRCRIAGATVNLPHLEEKGRRRAEEEQSRRRRGAEKEQERHRREVYEMDY